MVIRQQLAVPLVRLGIALALLTLSIPGLIAVFDEAREPVILRKVGVSTDCRFPFSELATFQVDSSGEARIHLEIKPETTEVFGARCTKIGIFMPGNFTSVEITGSELGGPDRYLVARTKDMGRKSDDYLQVSEEGSMFLTLPAVVKRLSGGRERDWSDFKISINARAKDFLVARTYSSRMLNLKVEHMNGGISHELKADEQQEDDTKPDSPWNIQAVVLLDKTYQLTSNWSQMTPRFLDDGRTEMDLPNDSGGDSAISVFLENMQNARTRDLRILFAGAMFATGLAIIADFCIDLVELLVQRNTGTQEPPAHLKEPGEARRKTSWLRTRSRKKATGVSPRNRPAARGC